MMIALYIAGCLFYMAAALGTGRGCIRRSDTAFDLILIFGAAIVAWPLIVIYKIAKDFMESR